MAFSIPNRFHENEATTDPLADFSRRCMLQRCGMGLGMLGLAGILGDEGLLAAASGPLADRSLNPMAPQPPHFAPKAKRVIWLFINGGPSHIDTWDYKPALAKHHGQELEGFDKFTGFFSKEVGALMKSPFEFSPRGQSGKMVPELCTDSLCECGCVRSGLGGRREVVARQLAFWLLRVRFPFPPRIRVVKTSLGSDVFPVRYG